MYEIDMGGGLVEKGEVSISQTINSAFEMSWIRVDKKKTKEWSKKFQSEQKSFLFFCALDKK